MDHIEQALRQEGIDADFHKAGVLYAAARFKEQEPRQRQVLAHLDDAGHTEDDCYWQWDEIARANRPAFYDGSRMISYGQQSKDGRMIFGTRGGYAFGSKPRSNFSLQNPEFRVREELMYDLFPMLKGVRITHGWGGSFGMPRRMSYSTRQTASEWRAATAGKAWVRPFRFHHRIRDSLAGQGRTVF